MKNLNAIAERKTASARILVVEDESIIALDLQEALESLEYSVPAVVASAEQAIRRAAELQPSLVLMDIRLQGEMDGIQAAEQIWEQFQIPVIYVTAHADRSTVERARLTAPFGYLLKPIKERELYVAIESALQRCERERWTSAVLKSMGDGVIVVDAREKIEFLNPMAETLTGWTLAQAIGRPIMDVFHLVQAQTRLPIESPVAVALERDAVVYLETNLLLVNKNGNAIPIADSIAPFRDRWGTLAGAVVVFRDLTARQQAEERDRALEQARQLQAQMVELERLDRLKDDFLSTVSHELRTPLTNIKMAIQMLQLVLDRQGLLSPENNPSSQSLALYMGILGNQCDRELHLVNDLLDLQRLNADTYPIELTQFPC
jgi:PAS domain S-box-containing protein